MIFIIFQDDITRTCNEVNLNGEILSSINLCGTIDHIKIKRIDNIAQIIFLSRLTPRNYDIITDDFIISLVETERRDLIIKA